MQNHAGAYVLVMKLNRNRMLNVDAKELSC